MNTKQRVIEILSVIAVFLAGVLLFLLGRLTSEQTTFDSPSSTEQSTQTTQTTTVTTTSKQPAETTTTTQTTQTRDPAIEALIGDEEIDNEWALFLINEDNLITEDYPLELTYIGNDRYLDSRVAPYYFAMEEAAKRDGYDLLIIGGHRTIDYQRFLFEKRTAEFVAQGYTQEEAIVATSLEYTRPGASEHNAAIAADISGEAWYWANQNNLPSFDQTPEFEWLLENSWKYGFILRYPEGKTDITGIMYEPWHYRFVGVYHAEQITKLGLTLEEYMELLSSQ